MRLIATRQIQSKEFGTAIAGQTVDVSDELGRELLRAGVMRRPEAPTILYETKVIVPEAPEVSARSPFRDVRLPDAQQAGVASESNPVVSAADVSEPGTADPGRRRGRSRSATKG